MKFSAPKTQLIEALQNVTRAVSTTNTMPILSGILFSITEDEKLTLTGSDSNTTIVSSIPVINNDSGEVVLPAKYIFDITRKLSGEIIDFIVDPKTWRTTVQSKKSTFQIYGQSATDFPIPLRTTPEISFIVNSNVFLKTISETSFAAGDMESGKSYLQGVCFSIEQNKLTNIATNAFRLALSAGPISLKSPEIDGLQTEDGEELFKSRLDIIVPANILNDIMRMLPANGEDIEVQIGEGFAVFSSLDTIIMTRLIDDIYMDYEKIIPTEWPITTHMKRKELLNAAERAEIITRKTAVTKLTLNSDKLALSANAPDVGELYEEITVENEGGEIEIGLDVSYLIDALRHIDEEDIVLQFISPLRPISLKPEGREDTQHIIMPVRL